MKDISPAIHAFLERHRIYVSVKHHDAIHLWLDDLDEEAQCALAELMDKHIASYRIDAKKKSVAVCKQLFPPVKTDYCRTAKLLKEVLVSLKRIPAQTEAEATLSNAIKQSLALENAFMTHAFL